MSNLPYKNPLSSLQAIGPQSVPRKRNYGVTYSVSNTGGYMEVYYLQDLIYEMPGFGQIEYTGNTIPINFYKGSGGTFSQNVLTLNSDNISSGRRRLGMLVYVYETDQIYQYVIDNYDNLWSAATASTGTVITNNFGTIVRADSSENISFINAWTGNTIEDISGGTSSNSVWKKLTTGGGSGGSGITGGTFDLTTGDLDLNSTGGTITITGFLYGSGTTNTLPKYLTPSGFTDSQIFDNGTSVGIGTVTPDASAILDLSATTKGFLPPRMTESERLAISSPTIGLMVYQTDEPDGVYVYKAAGWIQMI